MKEKKSFVDTNYEALIPRNLDTEAYYLHSLNSLQGRNGDGKIEDLARAYIFSDIRRDEYRLRKIN